MNPLVLYLIQTFAPVLAEALLALIRSLQSSGVQPDPALSFAVEVVGGLESSEVPSDQRRERAADAIGLHLREVSGRAPSRATVNALVEMALQSVRAGKVRQ